MDKKCPEHDLELKPQVTSHGIRWECPEVFCSVAMWDGPTSTPADYETRQAMSDPIKKEQLEKWRRLYDAIKDDGVPDVQYDPGIMAASLWRFNAAAREAVPALIAEVERLREECVDYKFKFAHATKMGLDISDRLCRDCDKLKAQLAKTKQCGLAISHGMPCPAQDESCCGE